MEIEENNQSLVTSNSHSVVLSNPGRLMTRMTTDLLPLAQKKQAMDDHEADPYFNRGLEALSRGDFQSALNEFNVAADLGHRVAQFRLAMIYLEGVDGKTDHAIAYQWFYRSATQGDPDSLNKLGWMCEAGFGLVRDQARAVNWFRQAAELGHLEAQFNLAAKYDNGEGVTQNYAEAARWYRLSAEQGFADARFFLAQALETGEGLPKNIDEAIDWYILAAEQGHSSAKLALWGHALAERYLPEDEREKLFVESLGVEMRNPLAEFKQAYRLMFGEGVSKNIDLSLVLYERSTTKEFSPAYEHLALMATLGIEITNSAKIKLRFQKPRAHTNLDNLKPQWMYLEGGCTDIAAVSAFRNNRFRAESGVESAISELACDYYFGRGTDLNQIEALVWLRKGVEIDDTYCNYLLGHMMRFGIGLALDKKNALLHLTKAAKKGHVGASRMAAELLLEDGSDLKKIKQAIKLWTNLANGGDSNSQFDLGYIYSNGERVPLDQEKAIYWYSKAADQGHTAALFNLGIKHQFGTGVEKNQHLALALYRRSAEGGLVRACEELSQIFSEGKFGEKNQKEADKWIAEANRLKTEAEKMKSQQILPNLTVGSASVRRQRLEHKRSLQRKASQILSGS